MDFSAAAINDLILDLSLASQFPVGVDGVNFIRAAASSNALVCRTQVMQPKELRELEYAIGPLLAMVVSDIDNPVAAKAAYGIRSLMPSRVCMNQFLDQGGLIIISRILDTLLGRDKIDMKTPSLHREIVEHLSACYREMGRFFPWPLVKSGALRHCVVLLRYGDIILQTMAAGTLATLSTELDICKQMFSYGAIKPLINASDATITNEACMLAGLGCMVQLCKIPEIGAKVVQQGVVPVLEKALHRKGGFSVKSIREKALYSLAWLTRVKEVRAQLCTKSVLKALKRELRFGTMSSRYTVVQMLMNLHGKYETEKKFVDGVIDIILDLLRIGPWHARNLCVKAICVLYKEDDSKLHLARNGMIESVCELIHSKSSDLQEAPLVAFLSLCAQADIPFMFMEKGGVQVVADLMLRAQDDIIRELAIVLLKAIALYDSHLVNESVVEEKRYMLKRDTDSFLVYGSEYGDLIEQFLQSVVDNRRDQHYLLSQLQEGFVAGLEITEEELESYQNTFMELDLDCSGFLHLDELKLLVVMMGEELDKEELQDLLDEYDDDKKGYLNFREFCVMMKGWKTRFGKGMEKTYNEFTKRGAVGRARRMFGKWWNQAEIDKAQVEEVKKKKAEEKKRLEELALKFNQHDKISNEREAEAKRRALGIS